MHLQVFLASHPVDAAARSRLRSEPRLPASPKLVCLNRFRSIASRADFQRSGDCHQYVFRKPRAAARAASRCRGARLHRTHTHPGASHPRRPLGPRPARRRPDRHRQDRRLHAAAAAAPRAPRRRKSFSPALHPVRCLILTPTRELAIQVHESVKTYGKHIAAALVLRLRRREHQSADRGAQASGVEILVATPGRLLDLMGQKAVNLGKVQILVLDEADRMLDMGFIPDIKRIIALLPADRGRRCSSRPRSPTRSASSSVAVPARTRRRSKSRGATSPIALVTQCVYHVDANRKRELLSHLVKQERLGPGAGLHARPSTAPIASLPSCSATASTPTPSTATRARTRASARSRTSRTAR